MLSASSTLLRRSASRLANKSLMTTPTASSATSSGLFDMNRRWKSTDAGDVIGIDLGTTNSCVSIMVRRSKKRPPRRLNVYCRKQTGQKKRGKAGKDSLTFLRGGKRNGNGTRRDLEGGQERTRVIYF